MRSPSAWKSTTPRSARPISRWISTVRPPCLPARGLALGALAGRRGQQRVLGRHPAAARAVQPARHALLDRRRAEHARLALRPEHDPVRLLEERRVGGDRPQLVGPAAVVARHAACLELGDARRARPRRAAAGGSARRASRNSSGSPVVRKRYSPSRVAVVLQALARERLGDLARGLVGREDERHVAAEHALEDGPDQRVVRAAEDDGVAARLLERRRVLAHRRDDSSLNVSPASISGTSFGHATAVKRDAGVERAHERLVAAARDGQLASRAARCGGCASPARRRAPRARSRRRPAPRARPAGRAARPTSRRCTRRRSSSRPARSR